MSEIPATEKTVENVQVQKEVKKSVELQVIESMCEQIENNAEKESEKSVTAEGGEEEEFIMQDEVGEDEPVTVNEAGSLQVCEDPATAVQPSQNKDNATNSTEKAEEKTVEPAKVMHNIRRVARIPKSVLEYMMKFNEDDTVTVNVTQLRVWAQGEMYKLATEMSACDWKTTDLPLIQCEIPEAAVDNFEIVVSVFHKDNVAKENERIANEMERRKNPNFKMEKKNRRAQSKALKKAAKEQATSTVSTVPVAPAQCIPAKILPAEPEKFSGANNRSQDKAAVKRQNQPGSGEDKKNNTPLAKKQKLNDSRSPQKGQPNKNKQTFPKKNQAPLGNTPKQNRNSQNQNNGTNNRMHDKIGRDKHFNQSNQLHRDLPRNEIWTSPVQSHGSFGSQSYTPAQNAHYSTINNQMNGNWSSPWQSSSLIMDSSSNSHIQPVPPPVPRSQVDLSSTALSSLLNRITSNIITGNNGAAMQLSQPIKNERDLSQFIEPLDNLGGSSFSAHNPINNSIGSFQYNGFSSVTDTVNPMHYNLGHSAPVLTPSTGLPYSDFISSNTFAMSGSVRRDDPDHSGQRRREHPKKEGRSRRQNPRKRFYGNPKRT